MLRSLWSSASGMSAQQFSIDTISNNLANVNTTGFKKNRAQFQDLLYQTIRPAGVTNNIGAQYPTPIEIGNGVKVSGSTRIFTTGTPTTTNNPLDLMIQGQGFFQVQLPNGSLAYTKDGSFNQDANGNIVTSDGYYLEPQITIPSGTQSITILQNGQVNVTVQGQTNTQTVGQIQLANFANPSGLSALGANLYQETEGSGEPTLGTPSLDGYGNIAQGTLEGSNVSVVDEMVNMIAAQNAYELCARAIQTSNDMLQTANSLPTAL